MIRMLFLLIKVLCVMLLSKLSYANKDKIVSCYVSSWSVYRPSSGSFLVENIDATLCTHVIYAFAGLNVTDFTIKSLDPWQDLEDNYGKGGYKRVTFGLKKINPNLKVLLAIGGWNEGSINYSNLVSDSFRRSKFVDSVVEFLGKFNFDGLDLDWEYPGNRGGSASDKANFLSLVSDLRHAFMKHNYLLTAALGASKTTIDTAYDIKHLSDLLDYLHVMCYDYHGTWDRRIGPNAPLYGFNNADHLNINFTIQYLKEQNANPKKIILGLPFYGRTFVTEKSNIEIDDIIDLKARSLEVGFPGIYTKENGFMGFNEICLESGENTTWTKVWHNMSKTPFLFKNNKVISYDDQDSIRAKVKFALSKGLGGVMIWSIDTDDFSGNCKHNYSNYPLLRTINEVIVNYDENELNIDNGYKSDNEPSSITALMFNYQVLFLLLIFRFL